MNIVICDSNALSAMELDWLLDDRGHSVCGPATSLGQCIERCSEEAPDPVLVGLNPMEGEAGLSLVGALAAEDIPSIIVSAEADQVPTSCAVVAVK